MSVSFWIDQHNDWETDPNFSNVNARQVCDLLGLFFEDGCGTIHTTSLDGVIRLATRSLNKKADYGTQSFEEQFPGKARVIEGGTTDARVRDRIQSILALCVRAKELNRPVNFG